ncbi:MAG: hypothetical protein ND807_08225 [Vicinamibacterales bacterium]|nr:hypothetical protein [Vicinamibacterales bacterium]
MKTVQYIAAGSIASAALANMAWGARAAKEVWLGMLAPLVVVIVTWTLIERVYRQHPERLTSLMMKAFAGKLVFFGAYVGMAIGVMHVQPIPFIVSFTAYFIALHLVEALCMKRMFVS